MVEAKQPKRVVIAEKRLEIAIVSIITIGTKDVHFITYLETFMQQRTT